MSHEALITLKRVVGRYFLRQLLDLFMPSGVDNERVEVKC